MTDPIFRLWGKSIEMNHWWDEDDRRHEPASDHLLVWHLLDVAAVAESLWDDYCSDSFKERFGLGRQWFAFLAAVHDIGKCIPQFQNDPNAAVSRRVVSGLPNIPGQGERVAHELLGVVILTDWLVARGLDETMARDYAVACNLLHGRFVSRHDSEDAVPFLGFDQSEGLMWQRVRNDLLAVLVDVIGVPEFDQVRRPKAQVIHEFAGLVKIADWVGSSAEAFPFRTDVIDPVEYYAVTRVNAAKQLRRHGLSRFEVRKGLGFGDVFFDDRGGWSPQDMQVKVHETISTAEGPSCLIVEDEMGRGKTEAALWATYDLLERGEATGLYFAMPTQATSRSQHKRVRSWVDHVAVDPTLVTLNIGGSRDEPSGFAEKWSRGAHRGLLPRVGVGTVDQVLLSVMPVKYGPARIAGLSGRVVVFDEVHAYDMYQLTLLKAALKWLAVGGAHVIILSATLPLKDRAELLDAFESGLVGDDVEAEESEAAYPLVSGVVNGERAHAFPKPGPSREIVIRSVKHGTPDVWLSKLRDRVTVGEGGVVGIICNSVGSAVKVYDEIAKFFPEVKPLLCLHARFTLHGRRAIEDSVMRHVGRGGIGGRKDGLKIIIGTQVLEQSLDIDFDLLVTEFAPIDLLLQRCGRVHRFGGAVDRPLWAPLPEMWLIEPPLQEVDSGQERKNFLPELDAVAYVYRMTQPTALLGTWQRLFRVKTIRIPEDIPVLVRDVYDDLALSITNVRADLQPLWREYHAESVARDRRDEMEAQRRLLQAPWAARIVHRFDAVDEDIEFVSRLGEQTIEVVPVLPTKDGGFVPAFDLTEGGKSLPWTRTGVRGGWGDQVVSVRLAQVADLLDTEWMPFFGYGKGERKDGDPGVKSWRRSPLRRARLLVVGAGSPAQYYRSKGLIIQPRTRRSGS